MRLLPALLKRWSEHSVRYSNLPDSYIKRTMEQIYWRTPKDKRYLQKTVERKKYYFGVNRPWTREFQMQNRRGEQHKKIFIEPIEEWSFFRGDRVEVLVGRDKGKQGTVVQVIAERNWVIVEGLNTHLRRMGKTKDFPGVLVRTEAPLLVTNQVALVEPNDMKPTEIEWRFTDEGERVRVAKRTGRIIPMPTMHEETVDYKTKATYKEREKDTTADVVKEITFKPSLDTFEMNIMREMGIVEEREPKKTYWY